MTTLRMVGNRLLFIGGELAAADACCCGCDCLGSPLPTTFDVGFLTDGLITIAADSCSLTGCGYAYENLGPQATLDVEQAWPTVTDPTEFTLDAGNVVCSTFEIWYIQENLRFKAYGQAYLGRRHKYDLTATEVIVSGVKKLHIVLEQNWENYYRCTWGAAYDRRYRRAYIEFNPDEVFVEFGRCFNGTRTFNSRFGDWTDYNTFVDLSSLDYLLPYWTAENPALPDTICRGDWYVVSEAPSLVWNWLPCITEGNATINPAGWPGFPFPCGGASTGCLIAGAGIEWGAGPGIGYVASHQQGAWGYFTNRDWGVLTICGENITDDILDYFELTTLTDYIYSDPVTQFDGTWGSKPAIGLFKDPLDPTNTEIHGLVTQGLLTYEAYIDCPISLDTDITLELVGDPPTIPEDVSALWGPLNWNLTRISNGAEENFSFYYDGIQIPANPYVPPSTIYLRFQRVDP